MMTFPCFSELLHPLSPSTDIVTRRGNEGETESERERKRERERVGILCAGKTRIEVGNVRVKLRVTITASTFHSTCGIETQKIISIFLSISVIRWCLYFTVRNGTERRAI